MNFYKMKPTYNYTMILPESFYGMGSFLKWTRVGQALSYKSSSSFIVWVAFSSKQKDFDYNGIDELWERGQSFDVQNQQELLYDLLCIGQKNMIQYNF